MRRLPRLLATLEARALGTCSEIAPLSGWRAAGTTVLPSTGASGAGAAAAAAGCRLRVATAAAAAAALTRGFHSSSTRAALGVVDKLHEEVSAVIPAEGRSRHFWEVLEFRPDGAVVETWKTPDVLGLHPRDVYLFASDVGIGQRATLAARSGAILFRTDVCKAVVYHDRVVLFPSRRLSDTIKISQSIKASIAQKSPLPFELKVLESLLAETARAYASKSKRLAIVADTVLTDINTNFSSNVGELQRLIPIQRKLTEVQNDVQEVLDAIGDTVNDDAAIKKLCLSERQQQRAAAAAAVRAGGEALRLPPEVLAGMTGGGGRSGSSGGGGGSGDSHGYSYGGGSSSSSSGSSSPYGGGSGGGGGNRTPEMRMGSAILESYEFKLQGTHDYLKEVLENIEQTRTVWHMQLDHQRNRVLRINLLISIMSLGGVVSTMPAAYFGMNLSSGMEELPGMFWPVVQGSLCFGMFAAACMWLYYKVGPKRRYKARLRDMRSLRDLLIFHLDDLDDVLSACKDKARSGAPVSKREFQAIVREAVRGKPMSKDEVDLLYRVFDTNKDGFLELTEMVRIEEHIDDEFSSTHLG